MVKKVIEGGKFWKSSRELRVFGYNESRVKDGIDAIFSGTFQNSRKVNSLSAGRLRIEKISSCGPKEWKKF